jgi:hypothetical protein
MNIDELHSALEKTEFSSRELDLELAWHCRYKGYAKEYFSFRKHGAKHDFQTAFIAHNPWILEYTPKFTDFLDAIFILLSEFIAEHRVSIVLESSYVEGTNMKVYTAGWKFSLESAINIESVTKPTAALAVCLALIKITRYMQKSTQPTAISN